MTKRTSYTRDVIDPVISINQNGVESFWNLPSCSLLARPCMGNVKHIGTVWPTVRVLVPKFDLVKGRDRDKRDRDFWSDVVQVGL